MDYGLALNVSTEADAFDIPLIFNDGPITNVTPSKFEALNPSNKSKVKFSVEKLREMLLKAPCSVSKVPASARPIPKGPVSVTEREENVVDDSQIASGSGNYLADNPAVENLIKGTKAMNEKDLKEEAENRKIKNLTKETTKTALKNRQLDDAKTERELRARCHADLTTYQAHVQKSNRLQVLNGQEFNRIFAEVESAKAEVELQKIQLQRKKMTMDKDEMEMQRARSIRS